jgi:hypothetical protein
LKVSQRAIEKSRLKKRRIDNKRNSEGVEAVAYKVKHLKWQ